MTPNNLQEEIKKLQEMISSNAMQVKDESISKEIANEHNDNDLHNEILRNVAESSIENHKQKRRLKTPFFLIVMIMYIIVIIGGIATTIIVPIFANEWYSIVPSVLASIASIITALIKIPKIIAEYLFPKEEDDLLVKLSNNVFKHDEAKQRLKNSETKQDK